ncbi:hypothetical protein ACFL54_01300 [Planctomycetota bacterium]
MKLILFFLVLISINFAAFPKHNASGESEIEAVITLLKTTPMPEVEFSDEPLDVVMEFVADITGINFVITDDLREYEVPIKMRLRAGISAYDFLKLLVELKNVHFYFQSGIVTVAGKDENFQEPVLRVYSVATLQFKTSDFTGPEIKLTASDEGYFGGADVEYAVDEEEELSADEIGEMIETFTGDLTWEEVEGVCIEVRGNTLLVIQTPEVHEQIVKLLQLLQDSQ